MTVGQVTAELVVALTALAASLVGAITALVKIGPERQVSLVGAQDTVIDNLREEIDRQRRDHERQIRSLNRRLAEESEICERRIAELRDRLAAVERKT